MDALSEEADHQGGEFVRALRVRVVPRPVDDVQDSESGWESRDDRVAFGLRVGKVRIGGAHDDQHGPAYVRQLRLNAARQKLEQTPGSLSLARTDAV